ncbi:hypothetical protein FEM48_Zijuj07G0167500 [Ziziphus jujuba var. spinosa]|uniref:Uncharacterized protein n=1 Tax=Ziziphus jujuba var. spinosa TaxID=714518 RepID=A0A978V5S8_ZIZJJ|nr:hypothetical protein FEM48_Zijuj07G0167500 [Ziziphus jujuba var. spinosa]
MQEANDFVWDKWISDEGKRDGYPKAQKLLESPTFSIFSLPELMRLCSREITFNSLKEMYTDRCPKLCFNGQPVIFVFPASFPVLKSHMVMLLQVLVFGKFFDLDFEDPALDSGCLGLYVLYTHGFNDMEP